jgi:cytochrome c-type biogenesis protein
MKQAPLLRAAVLTLAGVVAAWSWLFLISKWGPTSRIDILTFKAGFTSKMMRTLLQPAYGEGPHAGMPGMPGMSGGLSGVYATPEYYSMTEQTAESAKYQPDKFAVFYLFEDIHMGMLPGSPPDVTLRLADGRQVPAVDRELLVGESPHHRVTVVRFAAADERGQPIIDDKAPFFELVAHDPTTHSRQVMHWNLPIAYPNDAAERSELSLPTLVALLAGLLAVLSPCLLQLTIYYTFALAGLSMQQTASNVVGARAQVIRHALYFIAGFTVVFTAAGALAGLAGQTLQSSGVMDRLSRPLSIASGLGLLVLGVWVAAASGAPGVCRLPLFATARPVRPWLNAIKVMFMGSAFAIGCSTCFGGALFISLMIYVGAVGSAGVGALALLLFSLGIAVPYLLSALFLSRALPLLGSIQKAAAGVGLACSVVLIFFGVILITDNFHIPSNYLYRLYLGL